jgi:proteasome lid subunit RPN8/RPN11
MTLQIRIRGERGPEPSALPPPGVRPGTHLVESGRRLSPGLGVYIERGALDAMVQRAERADDFEVGGFLLGGYHGHEGRPYVDVTTQVPALKAASARAHLTFSNEAMREFHETHAERYPGTLVLGWYHTHPGYGLFLSADDTFIQSSFYAGDHHIAVVIDPHAGPRERVGVFVWEGRRLNERPYSLVVYERDPPARKKGRGR